MKVLMLMRDALPPQRVDVSVLFDRALRARGVETDFAGPASGTVAGGADDGCLGTQFDTGRRANPMSLWRQARLVWRHAGDYDVVMLRDLPIASALLLRLAAYRGKPSMYWMSFPIPLGDRMGAANHWRNGHPLRAAVVWLRGRLAEYVQHHWVLPRVAHVFVQSEAMRQQMLRDTPLSPALFTPVPMGVDTRLIDEVLAGESAAPLLDVIAYLGSLDRARELNVLIDAFAKVKKAHPEAQLWLIGSAPRGADVQWLREHAGVRGVAASVVFTGALPMREAWTRLQRATVGVSSIPPGPLHDVSSPTKVVEYLALGLPVVANDIPDQRLLLDACGGGHCVSFEAEEFARALTSVLRQPMAARLIAQKARPHALALRSYEVLAAQIAVVIRRCAA